MTFPNFLAVWMVAPLVLLLWADRRALNRTYLSIVAIVALGSVFYTAPWDNWLINHQVWWFDKARCAGAYVGALPVEELLFYVLIIMLGGVWTHFLYGKLKPDFGPTVKRPALRWGGAGIVSALWVADLVYLYAFTASYPTAVFAAQDLAITLPALALIWGICGDLLWHRRAFAFKALLPVGLWLSCAAGSSTFGPRTWVVNPEYSFGMFFNLIPKEMPFFYCFAGALVVLPATVMLDFDASYFSGATQILARLERGLRRQPA